MVTIGVPETQKRSGGDEVTRFQKVLVINPPSPPGYVANRDSQGRYGQLYPLGATIPIALDMPYLLAYLAEQGVSVESIEAQGLDLDCLQVAARIAELAGKAEPDNILVVVR